MSRFRCFVAPLIGATLVLQPLTAFAATYILDKNVGAIYDGIIDGVPFGAMNDGTPDLAGQQPSVALKTGTTELRTIVEIPLAELAGLTAADIISAKLVFNIDDVLGAFGPPPYTFDGTAAQTINAWTYAGNGTIALADYTTSGMASGSVSTGADGAITDATLASSGPLTFEIDLTTALQARLTAASTHIGITLATTDNNSATSVDNLGNASAGPYGVNGSFLPYLEVTVAEDLPPTYSSDEQACQNLIGAQLQKLAATQQKLFGACFKRTLKDVANGDGTIEAAAYCEEVLGTAVDTKFSKALTKFLAKVEDKCVDVSSTAVINSSCPSATTFAQLATCLADSSSEHVQEAIRNAYGNACSILTSAGLADEYPTVCLVP